MAIGDPSYASRRLKKSPVDDSSGGKAQVPPDPRPSGPRDPLLCDRPPRRRKDTRSREARRVRCCPKEAGALSNSCKPVATRRIAEEVGSCLLSCGENGHGWQAKLLFPADFIGFQGHFPGQPVVPGVCLIEAVVQVCARRRNAPLRIQSVTSAKFFRPVGPDQSIELHAVFHDREGAEEVRAKLTGSQGPVADIVLRLAEVPGIPPT